VTAWTSSLEATPASLSAVQESDLEHTIQDIFGPTSQAAFDFFDQGSASSRTSKDTSALDSEKSLENWKNLVTKRRSEYSARLKLAQSTSAKEYLSWPTIKVTQAQDCASERRRQSPSLDSAVKSWPTPNAADSIQGGTTQGNRKSQNLSVAVYGLADQGNHSTHGNRPESWATPQSRDFRSAEGNQDRWNNPERSQNLNDQMKAWATPRTGIRAETHYSYDRGRSNIEEQAGASVTGGGKLNPRWVETLMGLPVGWVMPSCTHPIASPATVVTESYAGSAENTTGSANALGQIATMTDNRTDELRLLGNGVVPATAALAFRTLLDSVEPSVHQ